MAGQIYAKYMDKSPILLSFHIFTYYLVGNAEVGSSVIHMADNPIIYITGLNIPRNDTFYSVEGEYCIVE